MTVGLVAPWLLMQAADYAIPRGALTVHPLSDSSVERKVGSPVRHVPDPNAELALVSYVLPKREDRGPGSLGPLHCMVTISVKDGQTSATVEEREDEEPCTMGDLTPSVVDTVSTWRFETVKSTSLEPYWLNVSVQFEEGSTTAEVDIARDSLASAMPEHPFEGLHVVERPKPRARAKPSMPPQARATPGKWECRFLMSLDERGTPTDIVVKECPEPFVRNALEAAWKWRFDPATQDGKPVAGEFLLTIIFKVN